MPINAEKKGRWGVILAAGFGSRLAGVSEETQLKPLTPVAGRPLLLRTIDSLGVAGCNRVAIVLGHGGEHVQQAISEHYDGDVELHFVFNPRYDLKNGVSVLAAKDLVEGTFILTMADHVFGDEVMELASRHEPEADGATLLVDFKVETIFDMDDATKVLEKDRQIVEIGKQIPNFNCIDTGLFVCTQGLMTALAKVYAEQGDASLSEGIGSLADQGSMRVLDIEDGFWQDVDTPEMLDHASAVLNAQEKTVVMA